MEHFILAQIGIEGLLSFLRAILYFVIAIFVLVTVHEFGHFIAGRIFGMRVPVFSVGMGRRLFGFNKLNGFTFGPLKPETEFALINQETLKGGRTDYRLSLLPIGGYAKIEGMIDETQNEALPEEIKPWEFRAKPWWQKSIVICAGVTLNTLLAWFIFAGSHYVYGMDSEATTTIGYVGTQSVSAKLGVQPGDKVVSVNNQPVQNWNDVTTGVINNNFGHDVTVGFERNGAPYSVTYRSQDMGTIKDIGKKFGLEPVGFTPPVLDEVVAGRPADRAGLKKGDSIIAVNGIPIINASSLVDQINSHPKIPITIELVRGSQRMSVTVTPDTTGKIGVAPSSAYAGPKVHINYGLGQSIALGWRSLGTTAWLTITTVGDLFKGKLAVGDALGGPVKIAQVAASSAANGLESFLMFIGLLSLSLAMINILPIPALDGGHLIIILIEAAIGHELSQRFKLGFQKVGIAILLFLMVFMVINDIRTL